MYNVNDFKEGLIYKYTSPSGKIYIGQTTDESSRKYQHKKSANELNTYFARALKKYGYDNMKYEVIIRFKPTTKIIKLLKVLNYLERKYIREYNCTNPKYGYNLMTGGENSTHSEETKQKLRESTLNRPKEWREKLSRIAKNQKRFPMSKETREKIGEANKGKILSEETKEKIKEGNKKRMKQINQYDLENRLVATYDSIADAARSVDSEKYKATKKTKSNRITECCNGQKKTIYGFIWKFKE